MRKDVDWKRMAQGLASQIVAYGKKAGRAGSRIVLKFYYAMQYGDLSATERAMVYAGIVYIVVPRDLLPRKLLKWVGLLDDVGVGAWIINRVSKCITPEIERKVEETLDRWFGPVSTGLRPDPPLRPAITQAPQRPPLAPDGAYIQDDKRS